MMVSVRSIPGAPGLESEYEMVRELGRGGMAIVYLAREHATGRTVAIKLIRATYARDEEAIARFSREAMLLEQLQHPRIVPVHAIRRLADGSIALIMEHVPGSTLKARIARDGAFSAERAERVLRDIADALGYAHAHGIVHRDVKPENIFIDDAAGHAFLSDFGIARPIQGDAGLTLTGVAIGTPTYMSPEQIDGPIIDGRSDLYSLGLVAWEMLTGRRPWDGENLYSVIYHQKHDALPPLDRMRSDLPARLVVAIEGLLEKNRTARWASAEEFLRQLSAEQAEPRRAQSQPWTPPPATDETIQYRRPPAVEARRPPNGEDRRPPKLEYRRPPDREEIEALLLPPQRPRRRALYFAMLIGIPASLMGGAMWLASRNGQDVNQGIAMVTDLSRRLADSLPSWAGAVKRQIVAHAPARGTVPRTTDAPRTTSSPHAAAEARHAAGTGADSSASRGTQTPVASAPNANTTTPPSPLEQPASAETVVETGASFAVVAGGVDTCLLTPDSRAYCWGGNDQGQIGNGSDARAAAPTRVTGGLRFASISPGLNHTCAITTGGAGYCWGADDHGQLGNGSRTSSSTPVRVAGRLRFRSVQAGVSHSCALTTGGEIDCWGAGNSGQLGNGDITDARTPVPVASTVHFTQLAVGWNHSCALDDTGTAYCWGQNTSGQIGDGTAINRSTPTVVSGDLHFVAIAAGGSHSCALTTDGQAYCWGSNHFGELGDGGTVDHAMPTRVRSTSRFIAIATGGVHTCAITSSGGAECWGQNSDGQLGDGTMTDRTSPTRVLGDHVFRVISAAGAHTCGTTTTGQSLCWGYNVEGQLGDGTRTHRATPVYIEQPGE